MSIKTEIKSGVFYTFLFKYANYAIQIVISAILARILSPEEYGVVAVVNVFVLFFLMFSTAGLGTALIQKLDISQQEIYSLFIISIILGLIFSVLFGISGKFIAKFYSNVSYIKIAHLLSISLFFNTINMVPYHLLLKNREFKKLGLSSVYITLVTGVITIVLALNGLSYYSLVYQSILQAFITFVIYFYLTRIKIFKHVDFKILLEIGQYSFFQFLYNILDFTSKNIDTLLIGKYLGVVRLGYYDRAYRLLSTVNSLTYVINPVLHPVLSLHQNDISLIYDVLKKIFKILTIIGIPLSIYLYFDASEIIQILYGPQWIISVPIFKYLSTAIWLMMLLSITQSFFQVTGKTNYLFIYGLLNLFIICAAILSGIFIFNSLILVAKFLALAYFIIFLIAYYLLVVKLFQGKLIEFIRLFRSGLIISLILLILLLTIDYYIHLGNIIFSFAFKSFVFIGVYLILLRYLGEWKNLISLVRKERGIN